MKAYQAYRDSGISWIGQIPKHWEVKPLKALGTCNDESLSEKTDDEQIIKYVEISDVDSIEGVKHISIYTFKDAPSRARRTTRRNDIIISTVRTYLKAIAIIEEDNLIVSTGFAVIRSKHSNARFLYYGMLNDGFLEDVLANSNGISYPSIKPSTLCSLKFPLPPLGEQEAIVSYLEEKTAKIDRFVSKKEEQILRLKELREAIIAQAVTRGIQPDVALRPSGVSWLSNIPEHWEVKRLGLSFKENKNLNSSLECTEAYKFNYGTLVRKDEGVNFEELAETYVKYTLLQENDIVINGLNLNYDFVTQRVALATQMGIITSSYLVLSPRKGVNHHYYSLLFKAMDSMKLFHGMGSGIRLTLSYKDLKNQALPLPPLSEQEAIVAYITQKTEKIDQLIESYRQEIDRVKELKQGLISDAVLGRINVQTE